MIRQIEIDNFKSIRHADIELGNINLFIGENGAGKSNILEAIGVISAAVYGTVDDESLLRRGGVLVFHVCTRPRTRSIRQARIFIFRSEVRRVSIVFLS